MSKTNSKKRSGISGGEMAAIGATAAALGAGAYYLMGPKAKKHQKNAKALLSNIKKEVNTELKRAKDITKPIYNRIVDNVSKAYQGQYEAHEAEIRAMAKKLKEDWQMTAKSMVAKSASKAKSITKRTKTK